MNKIFSPYKKYTTKDGLPGVKVRTWHPAWFIPCWIEYIRYLSEFPRRYKDYEDVLARLSVVLLNGNDSDRLGIAQEIITTVDCGYGCGFMAPYGFVPEDGCPIHDRGVIDEH